MPSKVKPGPSEEQASWWLKASALGALLFLHIPMWLIFLYSFTTEQSAYSFPPPGLTLKWIPQALGNPDMQAALMLDRSRGGAGHAGRRSYSARWRRPRSIGMISLERKRFPSCWCCRWRCPAS